MKWLNFIRCLSILHSWSKPFQDERQAKLRDHARRLIAEHRARSINLDSPSSPNKSITHRITLSPERTISPINNVDGFTFTSNKSSNSKENSPSKQRNNATSNRITPPRDMENNHSNSPNQNIVFNEKNGNSPTLQSFNAVLESLSPQHEKKVTICLHWQRDLKRKKTSENMCYVRRCRILRAN